MHSALKTGAMRLAAGDPSEACLAPRAGQLASGALDRDPDGSTPR